MNLKFLLEREIGNCNKPSVLYNIRNSQNLIKRFAIDKRLEAHKGCVNTISWSKNGYYILSGSDDKYLHVTNAFNDEPPIRVKTYHRGNIFSAKFLPNSDNKKIVSCSAGGEIFLTNIETSTSDPQFSEFKCHGTLTCYEVRTIESEPSCFYSCGKDGTVKFIDLRAKSSCDKDFCDEDTLIKTANAITSFALSPSSADIACGGSDGLVRFYDRRLLSVGCQCENEDSTRAGLFSVLDYYSTINAEVDRKMVTSIQYSNTGCNLLVSYQPEDLVLLNCKELTCTNDCQKTLANEPQAKLKKGKKFYIQSGWSDTGPNSQLRSEVSPAVAGSRLLNFVDTWLHHRTSSQADSEGDDEEDSEGIMSKHLKKSNCAILQEPEEIEEKEETTKNTNIDEKKSKQETNLPCPKLKMQFKGHRNSRTIIKECGFFGTKYVCSGSDCGHVFFWDIDTGRIVNIVEGDMHVVNCVQENPLFPILATSGIDHDVKIWKPVLDEPEGTNEKFEEIVSRNNSIIKEQKNSVIIPLQFLIPTLRLLRQSRRQPQ